MKIIILAFAVSPLVVVAFALSLRNEAIVLGFGGPSLLALYFSALMYSVWAKPLHVTKVEDDLFWIKGCSQEFLQALEV